MISYDDLVAALAAWRARQGLPVAQQAAAAPPPSRGRAAPAGHAAPATAARPGAPRGAAAPAPQAASGDFDDAALVEDASYDTGEDYVMQLGGAETGESTAISSAPEPPPPARGKRPGW
jgi:hypothetical protein